MKKKFLLILLSSFVFDGFSQYNEKKETEVIVIGTIHFPTKRINADTIYKAVEKVKPDIILIESGTSNFTNNGTFKENNYKENEWMACKAYKVNYPTTKFFPFDIEGRDEIRKQLQIN